MLTYPHLGDRNMLVNRHNRLQHLMRAISCHQLCTSDRSVFIYIIYLHKKTRPGTVHTQVSCHPKSPVESLNHQPREPSVCNVYSMEGDQYVLFHISSPECPPLGSYLSSPCFLITSSPPSPTLMHGLLNTEEFLQSRNKNFKRIIFY